MINNKKSGDMLVLGFINFWWYNDYQKENRNRPTDIENKLMVIKGEKVGEVN